jgi:hypothetical protein
MKGPRSGSRKTREDCPKSSQLSGGQKHHRRIQGPAPEKPGRKSRDRAGRKDQAPDQPEIRAGAEKTIEAAGAISGSKKTAKRNSTREGKNHERRAKNEMV